ncbi:hypothetical protein LCGC14_1935380, partial [marine sediment metagenome]
MAWWSKYPDAALARDLKEIFADYNPRKIDAANRERLQAILDEYGVVENLVVNKRSVERGFPKGAAPSLVSGHQRVGILLEQKLKDVEKQLNIETQKHLDTSNWALGQQDRADVLETKLKDADTENDRLCSG